MNGVRGGTATGASVKLELNEHTISYWSFLCVIAAILSLVVYGGFLSAIAILFSGLMAWSKGFRDVAAQGKRVMGPRMRIVAGALAAALAFALLPTGGTAKIEPQVPSAESTEYQTVTRSAARELCSDPIISQLSHPSTADLNTWDTTLRQVGDKTVFTIGLTAKNSFGLELKLLGYCEIKDGKVVTVQVAESR